MMAARRLQGHSIEQHGSAWRMARQLTKSFRIMAYMHYPCNVYAEPFRVLPLY